MKTIVLLLVFGAICWLFYNRSRIVAGVPVLRALVNSLVASRSVGRPGELGPLIAALYSSVIDRAQRTWWTRRHHVDGQQWTITASSEDAAVLARSIPAVEADLNEALRDNAGRHRIVVGAPVRIKGVITDERVAVGHPYLTAIAAANIQHEVVNAQEVKARPARTNFGAKWEVPTTLAKTIGETFSVAAVEVRLWPLGTEAHSDPIDVPSDGIVLGRSPKLVAGRVRSRTVSGHHAELRQEGERWIVRDLDSHNGTFIDGRRIHETEIKSGDVIGLGRHVRLRMIVGEQGREPTVPATG